MTPSSRPLFIPLHARFFDAFAAGAKTEEFRRYGPRWNERTCGVGRAVVLSRGYGRQHRLQATVVGFRRERFADLPESLKARLLELLGGPHDVARIQLRLVDVDQYRAGKRLWSPADDAAMRARYPDEPTAALALVLRRSTTSVYARANELGLEKSAAYLASPQACRLRRGDNVGAASRFPKGHVPANKGLRRPGFGPGRMKSTQFRKGERRGVAVRLYQPIGTERVSKDGYLERKVNDDLPLQRRWRAVHLVLWESVNGPLPKGHAIAFLNGDKRDIRLENLECITRAALMKRNTIHNLPAPLNAAIQQLGRLNRQIRQRRRDAREEQDRRLA